MQISSMHHRRPQIKFLGIFLFVALVSAMTLPAEALTVDVQFAGGTLFTPATDAIAKAAISAAAADLSAAITSSLSAIPSDVFIGSYLSTDVTFDWRWDSTDPYTMTVTPHADATLAADQVKIFVDASNLTGNVLGQGGPNIGLGFTYPVGPPPTQVQLAFDDASAMSEAAYNRGPGPVIGTLDGTVSGTSYSYSVDYGVSYGSVYFDVDKNNDGMKDSNASLENYWHFDHTTPVAAGKNDIYSIALHELLHALGVGTATSWKDQVSGTTWNGSEVQAITGSGAGLVQLGGDHIASGTQSVRISDGAAQEVVMDPSNTIGTRKELTVLDLAFLRDIGYETVSVSIPNPPDYDGDGDVDGADLAAWEASYGVDSGGDTDMDSDTDGTDFLNWQNQYTGSLSLSATTIVPEPSAFVLAVGMVLAGCMRRAKRSLTPKAQ